MVACNFKHPKATTTTTMMTAPSSPQQKAKAKSVALVPANLCIVPCLLPAWLAFTLALCSAHTHKHTHIHTYLLLVCVCVHLLANATRCVYFIYLLSYFFSCYSSSSSSVSISISCWRPDNAGFYGLYRDNAPSIRK